MKTPFVFWENFMYRHKKYMAMGYNRRLSEIENQALQNLDNLFKSYLKSSDYTTNDILYNSLRLVALTSMRNIASMNLSDIEKGKYFVRTIRKNIQVFLYQESKNNKQEDSIPDDYESSYEPDMTLAPFVETMCDIVKSQKQTVGRDAFLFYYKNSMSVADIATLMEKHPEYIRKSISRTEQKLRKSIEAEMKRLEL